MRGFRWRGTDWSNSKPAPGTLSLVQDFVNTKNHFRGGDLLGNAEETTTRMVECGLLKEGERVGEAERQRLVALREGLRELLVAHNGGVARGVEREVDTRVLLNDCVASVALRVRFGPEGRPELEPVADDEGDPGDRIMARLLAEVVRAEAEGKWGRLKACRNEGCRWAFYDASKNRSGSWCDMEICGARHKMRVYRERKSVAQ
jgi:predicted RNA-binding Zn ribbon-like protein